MAQRSAIVTVTTTATLLITGTDTDSTPSRRSVVVKNTGAATVFIGGSGVTTATGFPLAVGDTLTFQDIPPDSWPYGRVASGTVTVAVLQVGV